MSLNIKSEEAYRLTRELAALTGESLTTVVTESVRERLQRVRIDGRGDVAKRILELGREIAATLPEPWKSGNIDDILYDERGLPK